MKTTALGLIVVAATVAGCGGSIQSPIDGGGSDGSGCGCRLEGSGPSAVLVMNWECLCPGSACSTYIQACGVQTLRTTTVYPACGLTVAASATAGGPEIAVYDESGAMVGKQTASDTAAFTCPDDPTMSAYQVRAGRFPAPSCTGVSCPCTDGVTSCPRPDGGAACMCRRSTDLPSLITMSWDCFCDKFGCDVPGLPRPQCQAGQRTDYPECGLTLFTSGGFGPVDSVFDSSGRLVGQSVYSDTSYYACPDDPVSRASVVRGGQFPAASCRAVACDPCYAGTFPCPPR